MSATSRLLRLHAAVNKNRKEQSLPLHHDLAKALQQQKPANGKADDLVLVNGVFVTPGQFATRVLEPGDVLAIWPPVGGG